jgi:hypothetical protein
MIDERLQKDPMAPLKGLTCCLEQLQKTLDHMKEYVRQTRSYFETIKAHSREAVDHHQSTDGPDCQVCRARDARIAELETRCKELLAQLERWERLAGPQLLPASIGEQGKAEAHVYLREWLVPKQA